MAGHCPESEILDGWAFQEKRPNLRNAQASEKIVPGMRKSSRVPGTIRKNVQRRHAVLFGGIVLRLDLFLHVLGFYGFIGRQFLDNIFSIDRFSLYFERQQQPGYLPVNIRHDTQKVHPHQRSIPYGVLQV